MKRRTALIALLTVAIVAIAGVTWFVRTRAIKTTTGVDLGTLPSGVARDRLNLVIVTLDTTRADRIGAYGAQDVETPDHRSAGARKACCSNRRSRSRR